ncbi:MAG: hypothetical protein HY841_12915 [Bacteroidetes bacterium]|nr:hypothetical protein [Bacteroidota bacterium]
MKKSIFISFLIFASSAFVFAQEQKMIAPPQFTKAELLAFSDLKAILSAINKGQDYSKFIVRNFNLTTTITNADKTTTKLSEMGPSGVWSEKQKTMIEKYAKKDVIFTLENIIMIEGAKKGIINQPSVSFSIKE